MILILNVGMMKFLKFIGWSILGLILLLVLTYAFLPTITHMLISQELNARGFTKIEININRPNIHALKIPLLAFQTPKESAPASFTIQNSEITYSFESLWNNHVESVNIEHMTITWNGSIPDRNSSPSTTTSTNNTPFKLDWLASKTMLPILPFTYFRLHQVDIFNPLAPAALQHISFSGKIDASPERYEGSINFQENKLPLNFVNFSLKPDGTLSVTGVHKSTPASPVFDLQTLLVRSDSSLKLIGKANLQLHPLFQTVSALYPLPEEFQSITGTFSGTWGGRINESSSGSVPSLEPLQGDFSFITHVPTWPPITQDIQFDMKGAFSLEDSILKITLAPSSHGNFKLALDSLIPPALRPFIAHKGLRLLTWKIEKPTHVVIPIQPNLDTAEITTGNIQITLQNTSEKINVVFSPKNLAWQLSRGIEGKGDVSIFIEILPASTPSLSLESLTFKAQTALTLSADLISMKLLAPSLLHLVNLKSPTVTIPSLKNQFPKGLSGIFPTTSHTWKLRAPISVLTVPTFTIQGQQWSLGKIQTKNLLVAASPEQWIVDAESTFTRVTPPMTSFKIPSSHWQTQYLVSPITATIQFKAHTLEHPLHLGGKGKLNLLSGEGSATMKLKPIQFSPQTLVLSKLIQPWPNPDMEITHGTISASAELSFGNTPGQDTQSFHLKRFHSIVDINQLGGFFTPTIMQGLTTRLEIIGKDEMFRIPPTPLRIKTIQSAIELTDTFLLGSTNAFQLPSLPTLSLRKMSTHLLGGQVSLADTMIDPAAPPHSFNLKVAGLDLSKVLDLEKQEAVKGTGTLDGILPLSISEEEVTVKQGFIQGRAPGGTLQLKVDEETANAWGKTQPNLDLLIKSLENYHYSKLEIGVEYEKNGILKLATQLEGENPDFRNGVPIHFNMNIEENIPALMKSLSLVKDLEHKIEDMMTGQENSSPN